MALIHPAFSTLKASGRNQCLNSVGTGLDIRQTEFVKLRVRLQLVLQHTLP